MKNKIIDWLQEKWEDRLPSNLKRLADAIYTLISELRVDLEDLKSDMETESNHGRGYKYSNLSPYLAVIQTLINTKPQAFKGIRRFNRISIPHFEILEIPEDIIEKLEKAKALKDIHKAKDK